MEQRDIDVLFLKVQKAFTQDIWIYVHKYDIPLSTGMNRKNIWGCNKTKQKIFLWQC